MLSLTFIVVFVFCAAIASASILVAHQLITTYNTEFHRNYFYFLATFYSFAFYGIWAPIIMRVILSSIEVEVTTVEKVTHFSPVLGVPFLLISWYMLIKMGFSVVAVESKNKAFRIYLIFLASVIAIASGIYFSTNTVPSLITAHPMYAEMVIFIGLELGYTLLFVGIARHYSKKQKPATKKMVLQFIILMFGSLVLRLLVLAFAFSSPWLIALLILVYFMSSFVPVFYLKLRSHLIFAPLHSENPNQGKKEFIYSKYDISKREKEIIEQICLGKTNQQIADELFISLQTVKDHTHRIYTKIGINSRMKLVRLVNG
ncbi:MULTISPECIES: helix-turn-helix transcriptional regulator [unclassified Arenibacter]|uniref:helix-turn-helix transcriptional regulator n=1 Tax=unclassified Arenibacter TaxID=2615047 RepID=UPI000E3466E4|nr:MULTISPECIES: helix-turn-helix transcriptional regulator [unclassified Arenibacter]MCM4162174.1 hypothetical protein [Arenibacter sp. A80]RFT57786.1 LuxR family transcriptional regulator [Arenibacter sp. P308M17]